MNKKATLFLDMMGKERNIYECADLYDQNRKDISEFIENLIFPGHPEENLEIVNGGCKNSVGFVPIYNNIIDFTNLNNADNYKWEKLNSQFLNYHKSLTVHEVISSLAYINYLSISSGIGEIKNAKVVDVGGGTGHTFCSFFHYPETIEYYLVDPNLRLIHDFFLRMFVKLSTLKLAHVLSYAEQLPFKSGFADIVLSLAAIDHYKDYKLFIQDSYRILKPGGQILIFSHLDKKGVALNREKPNGSRIVNFLEKLTRYIYYRQNKVGKDDHTFHFENTNDIIECMKKSGFVITENRVFNNHFVIKATK